MGLPINDLTPLGLGAPPDDLRSVPGGETPGEVFAEVYAAVAAAGLSPPQFPIPALGEEPVVTEGFAAVESFASGRAESPVPLAQTAAGTRMPEAWPQTALVAQVEGAAGGRLAADTAPVSAGIELDAAPEPIPQAVAVPAPPIASARASDHTGDIAASESQEAAAGIIRVPDGVQVNGAAVFNDALRGYHTGRESGQGDRQVREPVSSGHADAPQGSTRPSAPTADKPPVMPSAPVAESHATAGQPGRFPSPDGPAGKAPAPTFGAQPSRVPAAPGTAEENLRGISAAAPLENPDSGVPRALADTEAGPQETADVATPVRVGGSGSNADLPAGFNAGLSDGDDTGAGASPEEAESQAPAFRAVPSHPIEPGAHAVPAPHEPDPRDQGQVADARPEAPAHPAAREDWPAPSSLRLDVEVDNLGPISVNVRAHGTEVTTILAPQEPAAARALAGQAAPLETALATQGLRLTGYEVLPQWQEQHRGQQLWDEAQAAPRAPARPVTAATSGATAAPGRLNYLI